MKVIENNFEIKLISSLSKDIFIFILFKKNKKIGQILVIRGKTAKERGVLDIFILPKYRCRWLTKNFAKQIFKSIVSTLRENNINIIVSKALHINSPKLLEFFGFQMYNTNKCYYLKI